MTGQVRTSLLPLDAGEATIGVLMLCARRVEELVLVRDQPRKALTSRAAFGLLVRMSNTGNRKPRDLARLLVDRAGNGATVADARVQFGEDFRPGGQHHQNPRRRR